MAVVHAHPPVATGFAAAGRELSVGLLPEVVVGLGSIPLASYGTPGTPELSDGMLPYLDKYDALLLANHGSVAFGETLMQAFFRMDTVEHFARITLVAELLGGPRALPRVEIEKLFAARARYGVKSRNRFEPGSPLAAEDMPEKDLREQHSSERGSAAPEERISFTREQLLALIDEALRVRGV
jgi:L-fuculose-phosphate aldolase